MPPAADITVSSDDAWAASRAWMCAARVRQLDQALALLRRVWARPLFSTRARPRRTRACGTVQAWSCCGVQSRYFYTGEEIPVKGGDMRQNTGPLMLLVKSVSGSCDLRCRYCFTLTRRRKRGRASYGRMSAETLELLVH